MRQGIFRGLLRRPFGLGAFLLLVLLYNVLGDSLRDIVDPRMKV